MGFTHGRRNIFLDYFWLLYHISVRLSSRQADPSNTRSHFNCNKYYRGCVVFTSHGCTMLIQVKMLQCT